MRLPGTSAQLKQLAEWACCTTNSSLFSVGIRILLTARRCNPILYFAPMAGGDRRGSLGGEEMASMAIALGAQWSDTYQAYCEGRLDDPYPLFTWLSENIPRIGANCSTLG